MKEILTFINGKFIRNIHCDLGEYCTENSQEIKMLIILLDKEKHFIFLSIKFNRKTTINRLNNISNIYVQQSNENISP